MNRYYWLRICRHTATNRQSYDGPVVCSRREGQHSDITQGSAAAAAQPSAQSAARRRSERLDILLHPVLDVTVACRRQTASARDQPGVSDHRQQCSLQITTAQTYSARSEPRKTALDKPGGTSRRPGCVERLSEAHSSAPAIRIVAGHRTPRRHGLQRGGQDRGRKCVQT